jgi:putative ABC transport system permease protein
MRFSTFILKNLVRRKVRSALTIGGVAVAVGAVVALVGIANGFSRSLEEIYTQRGVDILVVREGDRLTSRVDERLADKIRQLPGVRNVTPGLLDVVYSDRYPDGIAVQGWPLDSPSFNDLKLLSGRRLQPGDSHVVMLGKTLARNMGKTTGDTIKLPYDDEKQAFPVVGVYESYQFEDNSVIILLDELQKYAGLQDPPMVGGFQVSVNNPSDREGLDRICQQIEGLGKRLSAKPTLEYVHSTTQLRIANGMAWITSVIALIIGVIGILNTMIMSVFERTREIGVLRAMGWRKLRVVRMILAESVLLSIVGAGIGILGALAATHILTQVPPVNGYIRADVAPFVMFEGILIALAVGLIGGAYPAFRGAQLLPTEAIRHE